MEEGDEGTHENGTPIPAPMYHVNVIIMEDTGKCALLQ
jgi:hypothetical protein